MTRKSLRESVFGCLRGLVDGVLLAAFLFMVSFGLLLITLLLLRMGVAIGKTIFSYSAFPVMT
jgi:hypothetical protein